MGLCFRGVRNKLRLHVHGLGLYLWRPQFHLRSLLMASIPVETPSANPAAFAALGSALNLQGNVVLKKNLSVSGVASVVNAASSVLGPDALANNGVFDTITTVTQSGAQDGALTRSFNLANTLVNSPIKALGGNLSTPFGAIVRSVRAPSGYVGSGFEVMIDDSACQFLIEVVSGNTNFQIIIDGKYVGSGTTQTLFTTASGAYVKLAWASRGVHRVRIEREFAAGLGGLYISPTGGAYRPQNPYPKMFVVGDSFSLGTGATIYPNAWEYVAARQLGMDVTCDAVGGTGYANPGLGVPIVDSTRRTILAAQPYDLVVIAAGLNDANATYAPQVSAAATAYYPQVRAIQPNALISVMGSFAGATGPSTGANSVAAVEQSIKAAFDAWADPLSVYIPVSDAVQVKPWIYGTGRIGATNGSGNSDIYTSADGTHPPDAGHRHLGFRAAQAINGAVQQRVIT